MFYDFLINSILLYLFIFIYYAKISKGLGNKAFYLQMRRFLPCIISVTLLPFLIDLVPTSKFFIIPLIIGMLWLLTYPTLYYQTYKTSAVSFSWHFDIVFSCYITSWLIGLYILAAYFNFISLPTIIIFTIIEFLLALIPILQILYYCLYKSVVSETGMMALQQTDYHEAIEFLQTLSLKLTITILFCASCLGGFFFYSNLNLYQLSTVAHFNVYELIFIGIFVAFLSYYLWAPNDKGAFSRTGIIALFQDVKYYFKEAKKYNDFHKFNLPTLSVTSENPKQPQTVILIIGESASRDHMSTFSDYTRNTTPWLSSHKDSADFFLFKNSYACWYQTVPALERALTESNQYNNIPFNKSFSIIDIAQKAGYTTHWYSNQGYTGAVDTQITLIGNTADHARWTAHELKKQHDGVLLDYLATVEPEKNNFIVFHFMGSHDNFQSRYPEDFTIWGTPGKYALIDNYDNSLAYTDHVISQIYSYAKEHLNLQALVYFSDHATIPDKRRQPDFTDFLTVRIPMFVYLNKEWREKYPAMDTSLRSNTASYWTNDLTYDLICGILNIQSDHFDETQSLASPKYKFTRETLKTRLGATPLTDDKTDE